MVADQIARITELANRVFGEDLATPRVGFDPVEYDTWENGAWIRIHGTWGDLLWIKHPCALDVAEAALRMMLTWKVPRSGDSTVAILTASPSLEELKTLTKQYASGAMEMAKELTNPDDVTVPGTSFNSMPFTGTPRQVALHLRKQATRLYQIAHELAREATKLESNED